MTQRGGEVLVRLVPPAVARIGTEAGLALTSQLLPRHPLAAEGIYDTFATRQAISGWSFPAP